MTLPKPEPYRRGTIPAPAVTKRYVEMGVDPEFFCQRYREGFTPDQIARLWRDRDALEQARAMRRTTLERVLKEGGPLLSEGASLPEVRESNRLEALKDGLPGRNVSEPLLRWLARCQQEAVDAAVALAAREDPDLDVTPTEEGWLIAHARTGQRITVVTKRRDVDRG